MKPEEGIVRTHANTDEKIDIRTINYGVKDPIKRQKLNTDVVNVSEIIAACNLLINGEGTDPVAKRGAVAMRDVLLATAHAPYKVEVEKEVLKPVSRLHLPEDRNSINHKFTIGETRGYIIVGLYPDGKPGEIFLKIDKVGTLEHGMADAFSCLFSIALQHGVPLQVLVRKFKHLHFPPAGITDSKNRELKFADSIIDYVVRWMEMRFLQPTRRVVSHCHLCAMDFYSMSDSAQHDIDYLEKHRTINASKKVTK